MKKCSDLPNQPSSKNVLSWLIKNKFLDKHGNVPNYGEMVNIALPKIKEKAAEHGIFGTLGTFEQGGTKFRLNSPLFDQKDLGITNIPTTSADITDDPGYRDFLISSEDLKEDVSLSSFDIDSKLSDQMLREQDSLNGDILYSSSTFDSESSDTLKITGEPVNFREWKETRVKLLKELNKLKKSFIIKKASKQEILLLNDSITALEKELENLDENSIENIHSHVIEEIDYIDEILDSVINKDDEVNANTLLHNKILERLEDLETHFSTTIITDEVGGKTAYNFNRGLKEEEVFKLVGKINALRQKYNKNAETIIDNIITNSTSVRNLKKTLTPEEYEEYLEGVRDLLSPSEASDALGSIRKMNTLAAKSYGDILTFVLSTERDIAANREAGVTANLKDRLTTVWEKLKYLKKDGEYVTDRFFQKDRFGQRTSKLINGYEKSSYDGLREIRLKRDSFHFSKKADRPAAYKRYIKSLKDNVSYIDPTKITSVASKYVNRPEFSKYANATPQEMQEYEAKLRSILGDTLFEIELEKQVRAFDAFLNDIFRDEAEKYSRNPLVFIRHFESDVSEQADPTTFTYLIPRNQYLKSIPNINKSENFNPEFKELEKDLGEDFKEFYNVSRQLLDYTLDALNSERSLGNLNHNFGINDIVNIAENFDVEAMRSKGFFGDVGVEFLTYFKEIANKFSEASFQENKANSMKDIKFNTHFYSYGKKEYGKLVSVLKNLSFEELRDKAQKAGLNTDTINGNYEDEKAVLASALANNMINKNSSLDIRKRVLAGVSIAESINTRRSVMGIANYIQDYNKIKDRKDQEKFTHTWIQMNIAESGILNSGSGLSKLERKEFFNIKTYSSVEKELKKILKNELDSMEESLQDKEFNYGGKTYFYSVGSYVEAEGDFSKNISESEFKDLYEKFLEETLSEIGKNLTVGSVMGGLLSNFRASALHLNPASGITNREAGYHQNNQAAASGLYGFNTDDLTIARRFLAGARTVNTIEYSPWLLSRIGISNFNRYKQWKVLEYLTENLHLLESMTNDLDLGSGTVIQKGAFRNFLSDFAVNNAEFHNQMELLVAMMMNVEIEKKNSDGTISKVPLFDPKTMSFPFNPDTKMLLEDYRTEKNIQNWETFSENEDGTSDNYLLTNRYLSLKHKLHGNYSSTDRTALESSVLGKSSIAFQKWLFETFENEWGTRRVDHNTGRVNVKGRKVILTQHIPTLMVYTGIQNVFTNNKTLNMVAGIGIGLVGVSAAINPIALTATVLSSLVPLVYINRKKVFNAKGFSKLIEDLFKTLTFRNEKFKNNAIDEAYLVSSFLRETLARTLRTSLVSVSRGVIGTQIKESHIRKFAGIEKSGSDGETVPAYQYKNLSQKDRALISENAQQLADKMSSMFRYTMIGLSMKTLYLLSKGVDEEDEENYLKELEILEKYMNFIVNKKHQTSAELEAMTNISSMADNLQQRIFYEWLGKNMSDLKAMTDYTKGNITLEEAITKMGYTTLKVVTGTPKVLGDYIVKEKNPFESSSVYDKDKIDMLDRFILNSHKPEEIQSEEVVRSSRRKISKNLRKYFESQLEGKGYSEKEMKLIIDRNMKKIYEAEGLKFDDNMDWNSKADIDVIDVVEKYKDMTLNENTSTKKKNKDTSTKKKKRGENRAAIR